LTKLRGIENKVKLIGETRKRTEKDKRDCTFSKSQKINVPYQDLTPKGGIDEDGHYTEALKWALEKEEIKNIALTGPLGAGKSSVLKTFKNQYIDDYNYLDISLASFKENNDKKKNNNDRDDETKQQSIEGSILQQMFYRVEKNKIPQSRFKKIKSLSKRYIVGGIILFYIYINLFLFLFEIESNLYLGRFIPDLPLSEEFLFYFPYFSYFSFINISLFMTYKLIYFLYQNISMLRIKYSKGGIELSNDPSESILNKYLDEILYFFEVTDYNVVIIEDLDRYEYVNVFSNLRELNFYLNKCEKIDRTINFVYAIKDDLFVDDDKRKFFDFIIPIIPVINSSNSKEKLKDLLREANVNLQENFIESITVFISKMRLLENIFNEFIIYKRKLKKNNIEFTLENLFSMIVYKNKLPNDFSKLLFNKGFISKVFKNKGEYIKKRVNEIDIKIKEQEEKIERIDKETPKNLRELRSIYLTPLYSKFFEKNVKYIKIDGKKVKSKNLLDEEIFERLRNSDNIEFRTHNTNTIKQSLAFNEKQIKSNKKYDERRRDIKNLEEYKRRIEKLEKEKHQTKSYSLKTIIQKAEEPILDNSFKEFKDKIDEDYYNKLKEEKDLIKFLLTNGYINENYNDYITYFYPGTLTNNDLIFVKKIKAREPVEINYSLSNIEKVAEKLTYNDFKNKEILNINLLEFLLKNNKRTFYENMIDLLSDGEKSSVEFINQYIETGEYIGKFMNLICRRWENLWFYIENKSNFTETKKDLYLEKIIKHVEVEVIKIINKENLIGRYISNKTNFLEFVSTKKFPLEKTKDLIAELDIKFIDLNMPKDEYEKSLFDFIFENNKYKINIKMLSKILEYKFKNIIKIDDFNIRNYTLIHKTKSEQLIQYIEGNIKEYIENVWLKLEEKSKESHEKFLDLLNNEALDENNKAKIIERSLTKIQDINQIDNNLWKYLLMHWNLKPLWKNVIRYYEEFGVDPELESYLKSNLNEISKDELFGNKDIESDTATKFIQNILTDFKSDETLFKLLSNVNYKAKKIDHIKQLRPKRVDYIVDKSILEFNEENLVSLKRNFERIHFKFISKNFEQFIDLIKNADNLDEYQVEKEEIVFLLKSSNLKEEQKEEIVNVLKNLGEMRKEKEILDIIYDFQLYELKIDFIVIEELINNLKLEKQVKVILPKLDDLSKERITKLLLKFNSESFQDIAEKGPQPKIQINTDNIKLIEKLDKLDYISSYQEENGYLRIYTKRS